MAGNEADNVLLDWPRPGIAVVTLNRPARLNALSRPMATRIVETLQRASATEGCRVVILTGAGRGFCAGMDIRAGVERAAAGPEPLPVRMNGQELFAAMPRTIRTLRQPVIAAVNGAAAGAGMALTLAADLRVAGERAAFHIGAVKIGLSAGECGISYHLPRLVGTAKAYEIMLTGRPVGSVEAERLGLVSRVVPDEQVLDTAIGLAEQIAANSPFAVWQTKQVMHQNVDHDFETAIAVENRAQILAIHTEDCREAMVAFTEKRAPVFTGR